MAYKKYSKGKNKHENLKMYGVLGFMGIATLGVNANEYMSAKTEALNRDIKIEEIKPVKIEDTAEEYLRDHAEKITASEILNDYFVPTTRDEVRAVDSEYKDRFLQVTGEVYNIEKETFLEEPYVELINTDSIHMFAEWMTVKCSFQDEDQVEKMDDLEVGDSITINGYSIGNTGVSVGIKDCEIRKIER